MRVALGQHRQMSYPHNSALHGCGRPAVLSIWQQSESGMHDLVKRFVKPNDIVLDPFTGSGTTGVIALRLGCRFIGYDTDKQSIDISTFRMSGVSNGN